MLPASYVAGDLTLAYAGTVHAAQGATVDTSHLVVGPTPSRVGTYVGLTCGRDANTAHVITMSAPADPAAGGAAYELHRDPAAVLAGVLAGDASTTGMSAVAVAAGSATDAGSSRTVAERFADAAMLAATERTARSLDALVADGVIARHDRARLAAENGAASLTRVLRRAELAGHDPHRVLREAVTGRPLDGACNLTDVIHGRIRTAHDFDPLGTTWTEWTPTTGQPDWDTYLGELAQAADQRAAALAGELASLLRSAAPAIHPIPGGKPGWVGLPPTAPDGISGSA